MNIKDRLAKLEKSKPKVSPFEHLTMAELKQELFLIYQQSYKNGIELDDTDILLRSPKCRKFFTKGEPWLNDYNHRLDVFLEFRQRAFDQSFPNQQKIDDLFCLGWRGLKIPTEDIKCLIAELQGFDLGDEGPWLRGYLERSGEA
jgi:hypothetical protein